MGIRDKVRSISERYQNHSFSHLSIHLLIHYSIYSKSPSKSTSCSCPAKRREKHSAEDEEDEKGEDKEKVKEEEEEEEDMVVGMSDDLLREMEAGIPVVREMKAEDRLVDRPRVVVKRAKVAVVPINNR